MKVCGPSRIERIKRRTAPRNSHKRRLGFEPLEDRLLLSIDIQWVNRGAGAATFETPDNFGDVFCGPDIFTCTQAQNARVVVDKALEAWEKVIVDQNDGENYVEVTITFDLDDTSCGAGVPGVDVANGDPDDGVNNDGTIEIGTCQSPGWFVDTTPDDSAEYMGTIFNAFVSAPQPFLDSAESVPNPAASMRDLFSIVTIEMAHVLGLNDDPDMNWEGHSNLTLTVVGDATVPAGEGVLWIYDGGGVQGLFTTNNGGSGGEDIGHAIHVALPNPSNSLSIGGTDYYGARDVGNAFGAGNRRLLPSLLMGRVLAEVNGFIIRDHAEFPNFHMQLHDDGHLVVRGGGPGDDMIYNFDTGDSNDTISVKADGPELIVEVDVGTDVVGTGVSIPLRGRFPLALVNRVSIFGHDIVNEGTAMDPDGIDSITIDLTDSNWIPPGGVFVDGGGQSNELLILGPAASSNAFTIDGDTVSVSGALGVIQYEGITDLTVEAAPTSFNNTMAVTDSAGIAPLVTLKGGNGHDEVDVLGTPAGLSELDIMTLDGRDDVRVEENLNALIRIDAGPGNDGIQVTPTAKSLSLADSLVVVGDVGVDILSLHDTDGAFLAFGAGNTYSFQVDPSGLGRLDRNGGQQAYFFDQVEQVILLATQGHDTVEVLATTLGTDLLILGNAGDDTTYVDGNGPANPLGKVDEIRSVITVLGGSEVNELIVTDTGDDDSNTVTITEDTIGPPPADQFFGPGGKLVYGDMQSVTVNMGRGNDFINVEGTAEGTETFIFAGIGNDFITVTAPEDIVGPPPSPGEANGTVDNIKSLLWIDGQAFPQPDNTDTLVVIDTTDDTGDRMTLTESTIGISGTSDPDTFLGSIGAGIMYSDIDDLTIRMGTGDNSVFVRSTHPATTSRIETGEGSDMVLVRDGSSTVNSIRSRLTIDGQENHDEVALVDFAETAASTLMVTPDEVLGDGTYFGTGGEFEYAGLELLDVITGSAFDNVRVAGTSLGTITNVETNGSIDEVVVHSVFRLDQVRSPLSVDGGAAGAVVQLFNSLDPTPDQLVITDTQILGNGTYFGVGGSFSYANAIELALITGLGNDVINFQSTTAATEYVADGGPGTDGFLFDSNGTVAGGHVDAINGGITLVGGPGAVNLLILNDVDDLTGDTVTVRPTGPLAGDIGAAPGDTFFGTSGGGARLFYDDIHFVALVTSNAADVINVAPAPASPVGTAFLINGDLPAFADPPPGDTLNLKLDLIASPKITVDEFGGGELAPSTHGAVRFRGIELVEEPSGGTYDLVLNTSLPALGGNDGVALATEAFSGQVDTRKTLNLRLNGQMAFTGVEQGINSLTVIGSTDSDKFIVQETSDGFPTLPGVALMSHPNGSVVPNHVSIHFDGGTNLGSVIDEAAVYLTNGNDVAKIDAAVMPFKSGHINVAGQFTMSYVDISPVELLGAGGMLTLDARLITDMTELTLLNLGGDRYEVSGDGEFETTQFSGFDQFVIERLPQVALHSGVVVNSTGDASDLNPGDGRCQTALGTAECTLRAAIEETNAGSEDFIFFDIPGACPHTIQPATALPVITDSVLIDGYTQPGSSVNTLPIDLGTNAQICIEVNGALITDGSSGLVLQSSGNGVRGLSITGFGYPDVGDPGSAEHIPVGGIVLLGGNNRIGGNFIGVDPNGATADANNFYGLFVKSSDNVIGGPQPAARNLISGNQGFGIQLTSGGLPGGSGFTPAEFNRIQGNLIGTDRTGTLAVPNTGGGVMLRLHARGNLIGGLHVPLCEPQPGQICVQTNEVRNIISGNGGPFTPFGDPGGPYQDWPDAPYPVDGGHGNGIHIGNLTSFTPNEPVPNTIQGNFVGTTAGGMTPLPNKHGGIVLAFTNSVTVGGPRSPIGGCNALCNLVSANGEHGVAIASTFNRNIAVQGNFIGTDRTGAGPLGNTADGVFMFIASDSLVGGNTPNLGNVIAFNRSGVVVKGNPVIPNPGRNTIRLNSIHSNRLLGIDLLAPGTGAESDGPTLNDLGDGDAGPNQLQNFPVIASAQFGAATHVTGTLNSVPRTRFLLDFYASTAADPSGFGEGQRWIGTTTVTTNALGNSVFNLFLPGGTLPGEWITATATRLTATGQPTDTSEFSAARRLNTGILLAGCTLYVHGTDANDRVQVVRRGNEIIVTASFVPPNAPRTSFDASLIDTIEVLARGGGDAITVDIAYPPTLVATVPPCMSRTRIVADAGDGNDAATVRVTNNGPAAEVEVEVIGGAGNDALSILLEDGRADTFQGVAGDDVLWNVNVDAGSDHDKVGLDLRRARSTPNAGPMPTVAARLNVNLGSGNDALRSRVTDLILSGSSSDAFGGDGMDVMDLIYNGVTFDDFAQKVRSGDGADDIAVTWRNVDVLQKVRPAATPDLFVDGEGGDDSIRVRSQFFEAEGDWSWMIHGGDGADQLAIQRTSEHTFGTVLITIDSGGGDDLIFYIMRDIKAEGDLVEHLRGGDGRDLIGIQRHFETARRAVVTIEGNDGDDVIRETSLRRQVGSDEHTIDGGLGADDIVASFTLSTAENLSFGVIGGDGDDNIRVVDTSGDFDSPSHTIDGGQGDDDIELILTGTGYRDMTIGVIGGDGDDGLHLTQVPSHGSSTITQPGAQKTVTLVGGNGNDTIDVEFGGVLVPPGGTDDVFIQGGDGRDTINHVADGWIVSGVATIHIDGDAEDDTINVLLTNVLLSGGTLNLYVNGASDDDMISVDVQLQPLSIGIFNGLVEGQNGDDTLLFNLLVPASVLLVPLPKLDGGGDFDTCVATSNVIVANCEA